MPTWLNGYADNCAAAAPWPFDSHTSLIGTMHMCIAGLDTYGEPCWCQMGDKVRIMRLEATVKQLLLLIHVQIIPTEDGGGFTASFPPGSWSTVGDGDTPGRARLDLLAHLEDVS